MNLKFGVPCSQLKDKIQDVDVFCPNEEIAFGLAAGCILCNKEPIVYTQNSGFFRSIDILVSLYIPYEIPFPSILLSIRHSPEHHKKAGQITKPLIDLIQCYKIKIFEEQI